MRRCFPGIFSLLVGDKDGDCGHGSLSFGGKTVSAFASMRLFSAVIFMCDLTERATGCVRRGVSSARRVNEFMKEADCVQRLMLRSMTSPNVRFSRMAVSMILI